MSIVHQLSLVGHDKLPFWQQAVRDATAVKVDCQPDEDGEFAAMMRSRLLGPGAVAEMRTKLTHFVTSAPLRRDQGALIIMPRSGSLSLTIDGEHHLLGQQDLMLIGAARTFTLRHEAQTPLLVQCVPLERLRRAARADDVQLFSASGLTALFGDFLESLLRVQAVSDPSAELLLEKAIDLFLLAAAEEARAPTSRALLLKRAKLLVETRLTEPALSPASLARELGVSTAYLHALFQQDGVSPMRYVLARRLDKARLDLAASDLPAGGVSEIAYRWGFESPSHFSRSFRSRFGCPPSTFRRDAGERRVSRR